MKLADPQTVGNQYDLGTFVASYGWHKPTYRRLLGLWSLMLPFAVLASFMLLGLPVLVICIVIMTVSIIRLLSTRKVVYLYANGLIDARRAKPVIIRYDMIQQIWFIKTLVKASFVAVHREEYKLKLANGNIHELKENIDGISEIGSALQQQLVNHQLQGAIARIEHGESLTFNQLTLSKTGLHQGRRFLPWQDLEQADLSAELHLWKVGQTNQPWTWISRDRTPNIMLIMALIHHFSTS